MHPLEMIAVIVVLVVLGALVVFGAHRIHLLRRGGTPVVLRRLPVAPGKGWRHGVVRYREEFFVFFRVSSLRLGPDQRVARRNLVLLGRRQPEASERVVVPGDYTIIDFKDNDGEFEVALGPGALTAFLAWVESSPPGRAERSRR